MSFNTLYERDAKNQLRVWSIKVEDKKTHSEIVITHGVEGGKKTIKISKILQGKNIGKVNETSYHEQALLEAKSKWEHKQRLGYSTNKFANDCPSKFPMLAKEFEKNKKKVVYPCFVQPKLDGVRCLYNNGDFYSRTGKKFFGLEHIKSELSKFGSHVIDGELYSYKMNFNKLVGIVKSESLSEKQKEESKEILFVVYDKISNIDYTQRFSELSATIKSSNFKYVKLIRNELIHTEEEVYKFHTQFVSEGYEGIMIRNKKGKYIEKNRSDNLLKYKSFKDNEYKITGFSEERVVDDGREFSLVIWECETSAGLKFSVRPKGGFDEREELYKNARDFIGKMLTVKYQELTPDGVPRFGIGTGITPEGVTVRDYE